MNGPRSGNARENGKLVEAEGRAINFVEFLTWLRVCVTYTGDIIAENEEGPEVR